MSPLDMPFNVEIFSPDPQRLYALKPVTSVDYHENVKGDLHEEGLFSVSIFGRIGDEARDRRFSYIDIKTEVLHPVIYHRLTRLRALYRDILSGSKYATWDPVAKDFVPSNEVDGETGYAFFIRHWNEIKFPRNESDVREMRVKLIEKYRDRALTSKILVIPAGLRDIEVDSNGRTNVGEINALYRKVLIVARALPNHDNVKTDPAHNLARHLLQMAFNDIYNTLESMLTGKKGFMQSKWGSRTIFNSTRNVITAMDTSVAQLGSVNAPRYTDTIVGLWQLSRAVLPVTIHCLKRGFLSEVFAFGNRSARLVDPTTLKAEIVDVSSDMFDRWNTVEGLEKVVGSYKEVTLRTKPIMLDGWYLGLIYAPKDRPIFKLFSDINELPEGFKVEDVRPINLMELLYLSGYKRWNDQVGLVTRYPITSVGSCYPTTVYAKTTVVGETRQELDHNWVPHEGSEWCAPEFPTYEPLAFQDSLVIPSARLQGLVADNLQHHCG